MARAVALVESNPGTAILPIAKSLHIGARRGTDNSLGYDPVHRAISAGLLVNVPAQAPTKACYCLYTREQIEALRGLDALSALS